MILVGLDIPTQRKRIILKTSWWVRLSIYVVKMTRHELSTTNMMKTLRITRWVLFVRPPRHLIYLCMIGIRKSIQHILDAPDGVQKENHNLQIIPASIFHTKIKIQGTCNHKCVECRPLVLKIAVLLIFKYPTLYL